MSVAIDIDEHGMAALAAAVETLAVRATDLLPAGEAIRGRWTQAERRAFAARQWAPRKPSTVRRYRWPVTHTTDEQPHRVEGGVMHFTGFLERLLTGGDGPGLRDIVKAAATRRAVRHRDGTTSFRSLPGGIDVEVGLDPRGPGFYGAFAQDGAGSRRRRAVVVFDGEAHGDAAGDVVEYILGSFSGDR